MGKFFNHFSYEDRIKISVLLNEKKSITYIAKKLGKSRKSIYAEIKRATYSHTLYDWSEEIRYNPEAAHKKYLENLSRKGPNLKIDKDIKLANFIEYMITVKKFSPRAVLFFIKNNDMKFDTEIRSVNTIYSYIDKGIFLTLTNKDLPVKRRKEKQKKKKIVRKHKREVIRTIEERAKEILKREKFLDWEMDTVSGRKQDKKTLLVLTERKSRFEIIELLNSNSMKEVVSALNRIEKRITCNFSDFFKTITCDNGSEFQDVIGIEKSIYVTEENRTTLYFCHPYAPHERGSNENANKLIRRWLPKGMSFKDITETDVKEIQAWMNSYPRRIFNGKSPFDMLKEQLKQLDLIKDSA